MELKSLVKMTKKIEVDAKISLEDKEAREMLSILETRLETRIETINERTKIHTLDIRKTKKEIEEIYQEILKIQKQIERML